jgi:hypothetical protein
VKPDGGREHPAGDAEAIETNFLGAIDDVTDLPPMNEVVTAEHRDAGEIRERGIDQIERIASPRDVGSG